MRDARRLQRPPATPPGRVRHRAAGGGPRAAGIRPCRLPGERRPGPGQAGGSPAAPGGRGSGRGGLPGRHLLGGRGQRSGLHQPDAVGRVHRRAGGDAVGPPGAGRGAGGPPRDDGHRLLLAQRGQGDARRASPHHRHRRRAGPCVRVPRARRAAGEPHRRLGDAVRHAHRAPGRRGRRGERRVLQRAGPQRVLCRGAPRVRRQSLVRRAEPPARRAAPERRPRDVAPVADLRDRVHATRAARSTTFSACC